MPYRVLLRLMAARLQAHLGTRRPLRDTEEFLGDLQRIATSLANHRAPTRALFSVRRLMRRLETFGFHLATLDVRQDALVHRAVVAGCWRTHLVPTALPRSAPRASGAP